MMGISRVARNRTALESMRYIINVLQDVCTIQVAVIHIHVTKSRRYRGINGKFGETIKPIECVT